MSSIIADPEADCNREVLFLRYAQIQVGSFVQFVGKAYNNRPRNRMPKSGPDRGRYRLLYGIQSPDMVSDSGYRIIIYNIILSIAYGIHSVFRYLLDTTHFILHPPPHYAYPTTPQRYIHKGHTFILLCCHISILVYMYTRRHSEGDRNDR